MMKRIGFAISWLCTKGFLTACPSGKQELSENSSEEPDIIFLLTDDHRWDALGYAGNSIIQSVYRAGHPGYYYCD